MNFFAARRILYAPCGIINAFSCEARKSVKVIF